MPAGRSQRGLFASFGSAQAAEEAFYDALAKADLQAMMALWADDEDAVCVHPGGERLVGLDAIREAWSSIFENGGVHVRILDVRAHSSANCEIRHLLEQVVVQQGNNRHVVQAAVVNVYVKSPNGWHILMHHASTPRRVDSSEGSQLSPQGIRGGSSGLLH